MSVKLIAAVWEDYSIQHKAELLLMLAIADYSNQEGYAWPSVESLASKARCTQRAVTKMVSDLVHRNKLEIVYNLGPHKTNRYRILTGPPNTVQGELECSKKEPKNEPKKEQPSSPNPSVSVSIRQYPPGTNKKPEASVLLPESLSTPETQEAWAEWIEYRKAKKKPVSIFAARKNFHQLEEWGPEKWIASIDASIANDWQGLFPVRDNGKPSGNGSSIAQRISLESTLKASRKRLEELADKTAYQADRDAHPDLVVERDELKAVIPDLERKLRELAVS